jgi:HPt (histidine-containing phosphotransfer) domain-containing protein
MTNSYEPLLDRDILNENTMSNPGLQEELFTLFFDQGALYMTQLETALRDDNASDWHMTAHGIKGASRSLGLTRLAALALTAEKDGPDAASLTALRDTMNQTHAAVYPKEDAA